MAFKFLERILPVKIINNNTDEYNYTYEKLGKLKVPETLTDNNAFTLASTVSELYFPIDFIADRISKLRYYIADINDKEVVNTELNRFINDINPFYSLSELIYQYIFSYLADGNGLVYSVKPNVFSKSQLSVNNISRVDVLNPNNIAVKEYNNKSFLNIKSYSDLIKEVKYYDNVVGNNSNVLAHENIFIRPFNANIKKDNSLLFSKSSLIAANKSIDTLLSVYSARYNVYANNGCAGYLAKKTITATGNTIEEIMNDTNTRDNIIKDITNRNGLTGQRNLWGISGIPLEFVKTIASINELMPFEETLEDSIKIAAIYQIPPGLVPRQSQSTYNNQAADERKVWENSLLSIVDIVCNDFTKIFKLNTVKYKLKADVSNVSVLNENKKEILTNEQIKLNNLKLMKDLDPSIDISNELNNILNNGKK
jgi:hypothetical protein